MKKLIRIFNDPVSYVVKEADGGIRNESFLQDYIVPINLIERWGNAMGILLSCIDELPSLLVSFVVS